MVNSEHYKGARFYPVNELQHFVYFSIFGNNFFVYSLFNYLFYIFLIYKIFNFIPKNKKHTQTDGSIDFINGNRMLLSECIFNHQPKVGDMILFPHYLMHTAYPFKTKGERRSFSFNLEIDKKIANVFSK